MDYFATLTIEEIKMLNETAGLEFVIEDGQITGIEGGEQ